MLSSLWKIGGGYTYRERGWWERVFLDEWHFIGLCYDFLEVGLSMDFIDGESSNR